MMLNDNRKWVNHEMGMYCIWFNNRTHSKLDVQFCSIAEPNQTIGIQLNFGLILFDYSVDTPGLCTLMVCEDTLCHIWIFDCRQVTL